MPLTRNEAGCERLTSIFRQALEAINGAQLAEAALADTSVEYVIALGKAAESLAAGAWCARGMSLVSGFIATADGYATGELPSRAPFERHLGGHPLPDDRSVAAGAALVRYVRGLPADARVAVLISGGASACVEWLRADVDLALLRRANEWLLASGLTIEAMNRVRGRLSELKAGGLARLLTPRHVAGYVLVDVPSGRTDWVGGGPLTAPPTGALPEVPGWLGTRLGPAPRSAPAIAVTRLAGNDEAVSTVVSSGAIAVGPLEGPVEAMASNIATYLQGAAPGRYVWGGEMTLRLPARPGRGGRCRQLALGVALALAGREDWRLLAAATDGWDGTDAVAGACVDGATVQRGTQARGTAEAALRAADSGTFLAAAGAEFVTGPTGTNVNDLAIAEKQ